MLVAYPRDEEYVAGHIGRLRVLNGVDSSAGLLKALDSRQAGARKKWHPAPVHRLIADLLGEDSAVYVKRHSLLPFDRVTYFEKDEIEDFDVAAAARPRTVLWSVREYPHFCRQCVEQDRDTLGFSYWRRIHQIPGIDRCDMHGMPLSFVTDASAFEVSPDAWMSRAQEIDISRATLMQESPYLSRYGKIAKRFLKDATRVSRFSASACLGWKAMDLGLRTGARGKRATLSDFIKREFPDAWLREHYPALMNKDDYRHFWPIDGVSSSQPVRGQAYAMALAVLYNNSDEALRDFYAGLNHNLVAIEKKQAKNASRREVYFNSYVHHQGNHSAMARALQVDLSHLNPRLRKLGLPSLHFLDEGTRARLIHFLRGATVEKIQEWAEKMRQLLEHQPHATSCIAHWEIAGLLSFDE